MEHSKGLWRPSKSQPSGGGLLQCDTTLYRWSPHSDGSMTIFWLYDGAKVIMHSVGTILWTLSLLFSWARHMWCSPPSGRRAAEWALAPRQTHGHEESNWDSVLPESSGCHAVIWDIESLSCDAWWVRWIQCILSLQYFRFGWVYLDIEYHCELRGICRRFSRCVCVAFPQRALPIANSE